MDIKTLFKQKYDCDAEVISRAPGRLELLGNHTDYNEGFVISCAVNASTYFAARKIDGDVCRLYSDGLGHAEFCLSDIDEAIAGEWANYIKGVIIELRNRGHKIAAFDAAISTELPLSSGMSSSAALEIAAAYAIGKMNKIEMNPDEWARVGQGSENNYIGANTGLMDQFSSIMGEKNYLIRTDFRDLTVTKHEIPEGVSIVVANSGVSHDLTKEYNDRRYRCEEAAMVLTAKYGGSHLRDITMEQLLESESELDQLSFKRALHIVGENDRVGRASLALETGNLEELGKLLDESHESSRKNFENSCPELDILTGCGKVLTGYYGSRVSGGGFGGISIHLVKEQDAEEYCHRLETAFEIELGYKPDTMICTIGQGAEIYV
jgi:galactokinase